MPEYTLVTPVLSPAAIDALEPYLRSYEAGDLTAAGLIRLIRPVCQEHGADAAEIAEWMIGSVAADGVIPQQGAVSDARPALPSDPQRLSKKWWIAAAAVVAVGVAGGAAILGVARSATKPAAVTVAGHLTLTQGGVSLGDENFFGSSGSCN